MSDPFLYGAATSAHQVEGNNVNNDWWAWEQKTKGIESSGRAADHYRLWKEDIALAKKLGHNAHRFSIEWSRVEPSKGRWDKDVLNHYREVLMELKARGMKSFVTLHHFTNPRWLADSGGWEQYNVVDLFGKYVNVVAQHLGDLTDFWVTINEPMVYATQSYWRERWVPQKKNWRSLSKVLVNMVRGHKQAYHVIHRLFPKANVGLAKHFIAYGPTRESNIGERLGASVANWWFNDRFMAQCSKTSDFIGVNYYFKKDIKLELWPPRIMANDPKGLKSDIGWAVQPKGLEDVLVRAGKYKVPVYVTENGLADAADKIRADFIRGHLRAVEKAQEKGVDVRGYLHWSLLDNFEWDLGFAPRFGLVEVDYKTMERKVRPSAYVYKAIIEQAQ